jgi:hypothetical protein
MKRTIILLVLATLLGSLASVSFGQVNRRQRYQRHRIHQGVNSGEITRRERRSVKRSYNRTKRYEKRARSDGHVTWHERRKMHRMQNHTSRKIYRVKHNRRDRNY